MSTLLRTIIAGYLCAASLTGCHTTMQTPSRSILAGDYASARTALYANMSEDRSNRRFLLDRMRVAILTLADGYPRSAQVVLEDLYDMLRTQGINKDRTVASVVTYEGVRIWKGEPFEQALAMAYYAMQQAELGQWDNARAASQNALFRLRDFSEQGDDDPAEAIDTAEIARRSLLYERAVAAGQSKQQAREKADYLDNGYVTRESNFTLGYLLNAVANQQLGREKEAADNFTRVLELKPALAPMVESFREGRYNTVLIVSWGLGPRKVGYGPDNAFGRFVPRLPSDRAALYVRLGDGRGRRVNQVLDVNRMASRHIWRNLEDIRLAKSYLGTGLLYGGLIASQYGLSRDSDAALFGGLGAIFSGGLLKAGAHVDTRYCDVLPQRYYLVPLRIESPNQVIELQVDNRPASRLRLSGLSPPAGETAQLRLVRLVSKPSPSASPPPWAVDPTIRYGNPATGSAASPPLPWLLGGRDVRPPSDAVLNDYQAAGYLRDFTLANLRHLYQLEEITDFTFQDQGGYAGLHLLEGGDSMAAPLAGTVGFAQLFRSNWQAYEPRSRPVRHLAADLHREARPAAAER